MNIRLITLRRNFQIGVGGPYYQVEIQAEAEGTETPVIVVGRLKLAMDTTVATLFPNADGSYGNPH